MKMDASLVMSVIDDIRGEAVQFLKTLLGIHQTLVLPEMPVTIMVSSFLHHSPFGVVVSR